MANTKTVPAPASGTTSTTTPGAPAAGAAPTGSRVDLSGTGATGGATGIAPGSSMWAQQNTTRNDLALQYSSGGAYVPLGQRVQSFQATVAGGGSPSLGDILDYYIDAPAPGTPWWDDARSTTIASYLQQLRNAGKATIFKLQQQLAAAGFYAPAVYTGKQKTISGVFDAATQAAFTSAVTTLVTQGGAPHFAQFLADQAAQVAANGGIAALIGPGTTRQPNVSNPMAAADIQQTYMGEASNLTGRAHADYAAAAGPAMQGAEVAADQATYNAQGAAGGVVTAPPSPSAYADQDLRQNHGAEVGAHAALGVFNHLLQRVGLAG